MTNEEAIEILNNWSPWQEIGDYDRFRDALDMAIQALEQTNVLDKIKTEIKEWYWQADKQALAKDPCVVDAMIDLFIKTINKYKAESEEE